MKKTKKLVALIFSIGFAFLFTGCFEIMNYVTVGEDNSIVSHVKLSVIKNGDENIIEKDFPPNPEWEKILHEKYGIERKTRYFGTEYSDGLQWSFYVPKKVTDKPLFINAISEEEDTFLLSLFVPYKDGSNYIFLLKEDLTIREDNVSDPDMEIFASMLGSVNYNMIISKKFINTISNVYITDHTTDTGFQNIECLDFGDAFHLSIPIMVLFEKLGKGERLVIES